MELTTTDYIVFALFFLSTIGGWRRGAVRSFATPVSVVAGICAAYEHYKHIGGLIKSLIILVCLPILLRLLFMGGIYLLNKFRAGDDKVSIPDRLSGGVISLTWSIVFLAVPFYFLSLSPLKSIGLNSLKDDILSSKSYQVYSTYFFPSISQALHLDQKDDPRYSAAGPSQTHAGNVEESDEYKALMADERVDAMLKDDDFQEDLKQKNILALLRNPKMQTVLSDEDLIRKFIQLSIKLNQIPVDETPMDDAAEINYRDVIRRVNGETGDP